MSEILVVGSLALDSVETPFGKANNALGGSAVYFAVAASIFAKVNLVGVVGRDFPQEHLDFLGKRSIDLKGLQIVDGYTFRWSGRYDYDLNTTETLDTQLNVFADFHPVLPKGYEKSEFVFLANIDPDLQYEVLQQVPEARLTMMDTMDFWIKGKRDALIRTLRSVDIVTMNEGEARMFAGTSSLPAAAREILSLGPKWLVIKKGEYGAVMFTDLSYFVAPAYPLEEVRDPTGAGDSFAGGFLGYLAKTSDLSLQNMRRGVIHGSVIASFTVGQFSIDAIRDLSLKAIEERYREFRDFTVFEPEQRVKAKS